MRLNAIFLLLLIILASILVLAQPKEGGRIPYFTLTAVGRDGKNCTLSSTSLTGRTVLIAFYAYWCPHCNKELPELAAAWNQCSKGGDVAILVGLGGNSTRDYDLFKKYALDGWYFVSENYTFAKLFGIEYIPAVIIADGNGVVRQVNVGEAGRGKYCIGINLAHSKSTQNNTVPIPCEQNKSKPPLIPLELAVALAIIALITIAALIRIRGKF
ncbi:MAG: peroxiredoxin family protein [Candidatus Methanodesulfokora sp.]